MRTPISVLVAVVFIISLPLSIVGQSTAVDTLQEALSVPADSTARRLPPRVAPNNHLLLDATALPYKNRGLYRNTMLLGNQVDVAIHPNFSIGGTIFVPFFATARLQARVSLSELFHIGASIQRGVIIYGEGSVTAPAGMLTIGNHTSYLNMSYGTWIEEKARMRKVGIAGSHAFNDQWRLRAELLLLMTTYETDKIFTLNASYHKHRSTVEMGFINIYAFSSLPVLPLVTYGYNF